MLLHTGEMLTYVWGEVCHSFHVPCFGRLSKLVLSHQIRRLPHRARGTFGVGQTLSKPQTKIMHAR
jgi:hypothetical protein